MCSNKFKLVILDECDAMTRDAQFALRRGTIEPHDTARVSLISDLRKEAYKAPVVPIP